MKKGRNFNIWDALKQWSGLGKLIDFRPYGNGHINDTFLVRYENDDLKTVKYILQKINKCVFKNPEQVMSNIMNVTEFLKKKISSAGGDPERETLTVLKNDSGCGYYTDGAGDYWRMLGFISDAVSLDLPETSEDFYQSAIAFGRFQHMLSDFPADTLYETIPDFHNTPVRFKAFMEAVENDICSRAEGVKDEIDFVIRRKEYMNTLEDAHKAGKLPLKVTHNDTKMNNVLLDKDTREPVCVVDLDTIMPGYSVNDFGDSIRFGASTAAEDEKDLDKVHFDMTLFETYTRGFLKGCGGILSDGELKYLPDGAIMMTLECGMRFLTDYLCGDRYFKTAYPEHNLVRCRTQFRLVSEMENEREKMNSIIERYR